MSGRRPSHGRAQTRAEALRLAHGRAAEIERLRREHVEQAKRIADLERQTAMLQQNSTMTSKPPSSDGLAGRQRARRPVKGRCSAEAS